MRAPRAGLWALVACCLLASGLPLLPTSPPSLDDRLVRIVRSETEAERSLCAAAETGSTPQDMAAGLAALRGVPVAHLRPTVDAVIAGCAR